MVAVTGPATMHVVVLIGMVVLVWLALRGWRRRFREAVMLRASLEAQVGNLTTENRILTANCAELRAQMAVSQQVHVEVANGRRGDGDSVPWGHDRGSALHPVLPGLDVGPVGREGMTHDTDSELLPGDSPPLAGGNVVPPGRDPLRPVGPSALGTEGGGRLTGLPVERCPFGCGDLLSPSAVAIHRLTCPALAAS